jgi:periplasmic divalent cation tolerance protein
MEDEYILVLTTIAGQEQAGELARSIVSAGLAACVQIQAIRSVYRWKGEVCDEPEHLLMIKTAERRYADLERHIRANHSYETPEIVKLPIAGGSREYLAWIGESVDEKDAGSE